MKKETGILIAGSLGLFIGLGFFGVRKFLLKKSKEYNSVMNDKVGIRINGNERY